MSSMLLGAKDEELSKPLLVSSGAKPWCHKGTCLGVALAMVFACTVGVAVGQQPLLNSSIKKKLVMLVAMQDKSSIVHGIEGTPNYGHLTSSDFPKSRPWVYLNFVDCMGDFWLWAPIMTTFSSTVYKNEQRLCYCAYINSTSAADAQHRNKIVSWCVEDYQGNSHAAETCFADVCPSAVQKCTDPPCF
ncbi:unnamed protein product [Symbiodinium sp. CCMP2592]|nr:unnamed protein product [Symbiodinium sp. CCMP2592]